MFLTSKLYFCSTEFLKKIELFICIKMDLVLFNIQRLICRKTQTNKQTNSSEDSESVLSLICFDYSHDKKC